MPELPEVETMRRGLLPIVGRRIERLECVDCPRKPILIAPRPDRFRSRTEGRTVTAVDRAGKRVVIRLDSHDAIVVEPRMTGLLLLARGPSAEVPEPLYVRLRITLAGGRQTPVPGYRGETAPASRPAKPARPRSATCVLYWDRRGLGTVRLLDPGEQQAALGAGRLGPDALQTTAPLLRERLGHSRQPIKVALMDQRKVAGIGNLYASEILHLAGIRPTRACRRLRGREWEVLAGAIIAVLEEAIRYEGSTLSDGTYRNALNEAGGYQNHHRVYDRAGKPCPRCGRGTTRRIVQAQRSTFYCPSCQK
jgi:formamidopyrimidine-DNA glycosylase